MGSGSMFDRIAPRYDLLNRILSLGLDGGWRRRAVRAMRSATSAVPVATSRNSWPASARSARAHPGARVVGVDPSSQMLEVGAQKVLRDGVGDRVRLQLGNCEHLPFADRRFDGSIIAFGIRNVPDRAAGVREMARVTRVGRPVVILELAEPTAGVAGSFARFYIHHVVPRIGAWLSGAREYRYLQQSVEAFPAAEAFARLMGANGVRVRSFMSLGFGACTLYVGESE
jgi:demethylmenaquinone methyltransferase / 2-methoxy-6-polyprenyl-1,4-benzoquinol methylase